MTRRPLIAGNWKMNCGTASGVDLARAVAAGAKGISAELVVSPPYPILASVVQALASTPVGVSAQNVHEKPSGAFTGEVSVEMLLETGVRWVIIGHSERRQFFNETDETVALKTKACLDAGLKPIICVGETLAERDAGKTLEVVFRQLDAFSPLVADKASEIAIAYEPVWAIGTGKVATPEQAQEVHAATRAHLAKSSKPLAEAVRILYGGSVKPDNAKELLGCSDIDGALVGGASLKAEDFLAIAAAAQ